MARFRVSRKAQDDIRDIGYHTQRVWGSEQRRTYLSGLDAQFKFLAENPSLSPDRTEFSPPVRLFPYRRHLIVFLPEGDGILVVRVLHRRMDITAHLDRPF